MRNLAIAMLLGGCATLAQDGVVIACQAADTVTTVVALGRGAREGNPLLGEVVRRAGVAGLVAVKVLFVWWLLHNFTTETEEERAVRATASVTGCLAALHNGTVILK